LVQADDIDDLLHEQRVRSAATPRRGGTSSCPPIRTWRSASA